MAAVHPSNSSNNNNDTASSSSNRRNGTASPGGWHFPKSGLGTPDLFYSFSGGSSSNGNSHQPAPPSSSHQQQQQQPAWFKPQGGSSSGSNTVAAPGQASSSNQVKADQAMAGPSASSSSIIKKEEPDDGDDDDAKEQAASHQSGFQSKFSRDNEEANRTHRALSDPPVRQSPAWIFPSAGPGGGGGFGPHKTHLEQEPNPFEHSFSRTDSDPTGLSQHHQFAQAINAGHGHANSHVGYPANALVNANNSYEIGPSRRARSQSPKSAGWQHSGITAHNSFNSNLYQEQASSYLGNNLFSNAPGPNVGGAGNNKGTFGNISTPSSELPSFGWAFDQQAASTAGNGGASGLFDPTSIRTGLTPGGALDTSKHSHHLNSLHNQSTSTTMGGGAPHSPATQALFAMMTNATPGSEVGPYSTAQKNQAPLSGIQHHQAALGDASRSSSNNSSSGASQQQQQQRPPSAQPMAGGNEVAQGIYSQAVPRPMQPTNQYSSMNQPMHPSYHGGHPAYLQQNVPRPLPPRAFDSTQSSEASSSQSVPQIVTQHHQPGAQRVGGTDQNPLYLLSQHAQDGQQQPHPPQSLPPNAVARLHPQGAHLHHQRHPSDTQGPAASSSHNEDAMLAAAALSGLSTPRPAYVGGPPPTNMPSVNPGTINAAQPVPNLVQPPLGRQQQQKPIPPPANLFHEQKPPHALTKDNMNANNKANASKKGAANSNKRKKGANNATPEPSTGAGARGGAEDSKKVRRTSRRTAASASAQSLAEPPSDDELDPSQSQSQSQLQPNLYNDDNSFDRSGAGGGGDMMGGYSDDDDDMMSNNGSMNGSRDGMGGSQMGEGSQVSPPRKGGRGPKQHFATEEEKRKNFLERNRQAALKCRQRKKQWLTQLQSKVEYLTADNETLQATVGRLREEVANLRAILGAHSDCQMNVPPGPTGPGGVTTVGAYLHGAQQQGIPPHQQQHPPRQY